MRQFVAETSLDKNGILFVQGDEKKFHYLTNVLRVAVGDMIYVRLPNGELKPMTVCSIDSGSKKVVMQVAGEIENQHGEEKNLLHALPLQKSSSLELWLFMFIAKPPKMELIIRQAVESGVSVIVPVEGKFSQKGNIESARKKLNEKDERIKRVITEAMEQSGSPVCTKVLAPVSLDDACKLWQNQNGQLGLVLYEQTADTKSIFNACNSSDTITKAALAVGAEGGIAPEEIQKLKNSGFIPVHFNTNILRCETAALYGIAALQTVVLEKGKWQIKE